MFWFIVIAICLINRVVWSYESELESKYDGYGEDWMFIPDGNGRIQVAVLKGHISEIKGTEIESPIAYILYTRANPDKGIKFYSNDTRNVKHSPYSPHKKTKMIVHGWKSSVNNAGFIDMKDAYLQYGDYNVFLVDWEPLAASTFYLGPMKNTVKVGKDAANFVDLLVSNTGLKITDVHFIGHSLGAHVAGNAGFYTKHGKLGRITGLDPAFPVIHKLVTEEGRLDSSDASFVDVIHSCGGILGFFEPLGHADFYPNAGTPVQPGCCCIPELVEACSHARSYLYFTESINSQIGFLSKQCTDWDTFKNGNCGFSHSVLMGEHVDPSIKGMFFLKTQSSSPFALLDNVVNSTI